jgi:hypothetical protein
MDIKRVRQELFDRGSLASLVNGRGIARSEQQIVALPAGFGVAPETGPNVTPDTKRWRRCGLRVSKSKPWPEVIAYTMLRASHPRCFLGVKRLWCDEYVARWFREVFEGGVDVRGREQRGGVARQDLPVEGRPSEARTSPAQAAALVGVLSPDFPDEPLSMAQDLREPPWFSGVFALFLPS